MNFLSRLFFFANLTSEESLLYQSVFFKMQLTVKQSSTNNKCFIESFIYGVYLKSFIGFFSNIARCYNLNNMTLIIIIATNDSINYF